MDNVRREEIINLLVSLCGIPRSLLLRLDESELEKLYIERLDEVHHPDESKPTNVYYIV
ncbi:hypothetical protein [Salsuginibacillus kocurii]|uniref:hypothetical protein n=1 Tax=Salsuginibacillus kocurii TaxID=427078 RepID=UPI000367CE59|nr:hypothetical protein [Salsuginibacillus kocurii]